MKLFPFKPVTVKVDFSDLDIQKIMDALEPTFKAYVKSEKKKSFQDGLMIGCFATVILSTVFTMIFSDKKL